MEYKGTLIAVNNMKRSVEFYTNVLGLKVIDDFGANVMLSGGIFLQTTETWKSFINKEISYESNSYELYFEADDFDKFVKELDAELVHPVKEHSWGQRAVRFYDPDMHIIEVGERLNAVIERFRKSGLCDKEIAEKMDVPQEYVEKY